MRRLIGTRGVAVKWCISFVVAGAVALGVAGVARACPIYATFSAFPAAAAPGDQVTISGGGFYDGVPLRLHMDSATGPLLATVLPAVGNNQEGTFRTTVTIPVLAPGAHEMWAEDGMQPEPAFMSTQTFQVNPLPPPGAPSGLTATAVSPTSVHLSWNPVDIATAYQVLRSTGSGFSPVGAPTAATFDDNGASPATSYSYEVKATNPAGTSPPSKRVSVTTPPAAPTGLSATAASASEIQLAWTASMGATGYDVLRTSGDATYSTVANVMGTAYTDSGLTPGTAYSYEVAATNGGGASPPSTAVTATTPAGTSGGTGDGSGSSGGGGTSTGGGNGTFSAGNGNPPGGNGRGVLSGVLPPSAGLGLAGPPSAAGSGLAPATSPTTARGAARGAEPADSGTGAAPHDSGGVAPWPGIVLLIVGPLLAVGTAGVLARRRHATERAKQ